MYLSTLPGREGIWHMLLKYNAVSTEQGNNVITVLYMCCQAAHTVLFSKCYQTNVEVSWLWTQKT